MKGITPLAAVVAIVFAGLAAFLFFSGHGGDAGGFLAIAVGVLGIVLHPGIP